MSYNPSAGKAHSVRGESASRINCSKEVAARMGGVNRNKDKIANANDGSRYPHGWRE